MLLLQKYIQHLLVYKSQNFVWIDHLESEGSTYTRIAWKRAWWLVHIHTRAHLRGARVSFHVAWKRALWFAQEQIQSITFKQRCAFLSLSFWCVIVTKNLAEQRYVCEKEMGWCPCAWCGSLQWHSKTCGSWSLSVWPPLQ